MESFEDIRKKEIENLTGEMKTLGQQLVKLGWSREKVLAYMTQLLNEPTGNISEDPDVGKEDL